DERADNRYRLTVADLPNLSALRGRGIRHVVNISHTAARSTRRDGQIGSASARFPGGDPPRVDTVGASARFPGGDPLGSTPSVSATFSPGGDPSVVDSVSASARFLAGDPPRLDSVGASAVFPG